MIITSNILFQGVTASAHLEAVKGVFSIEDPERIIISVAFMNYRGLTTIRDSLAAVAGRTTLVTGIRNGITSAQGLQLGLEVGCSIYVVDTGSRTTIFHPKVYLSYNTNEARLIVGSANLTVGGMTSNIEASLCLTIDLGDPQGMAFIEDIENTIDTLLTEHADNVTLVSDNVTIQQLLAAGRVIDESIASPPAPISASRDPRLDSVTKMVLKTRRVLHLRPERFPVELDQGAEPEAHPENMAESVTKRWSLVWQSSPLTRRDLNIPTGPNTNPTGSMLFSQGEMEDIDQRHYFRDIVFNHLDWKPDAAPARRHLERAEARFRLIIRNVDCGQFAMRLSHNTRTDSRAYEQRNSMTSLHWGNTVRSYVAREDLLYRTLFLYRDEEKIGTFILEID